MAESPKQIIRKIRIKNVERVRRKKVVRKPLPDYHKNIILILTAVIAQISWSIFLRFRKYFAIWSLVNFLYSAVYCRLNMRVSQLETVVSSIVLNNVLSHWCIDASPTAVFSKNHITNEWILLFIYWYLSLVFIVRFPWLCYVLSPAQCFGALPAQNNWEPVT